MRSSLETVAQTDWPKGDYRPLATIRTDYQKLSEVSGVTFRRCDEDGLGETYVSGLKTKSGVHFILIDNVHLPGGRRVQIEVLHSGDLSVKLCEVIQALGLSENELDWVCDNAHGAA